MNHDPNIAHDPVTHDAIVTKESGTRPLGMPSLSWGAVFAGLFVILALGCLFEMLGAAIGVSVADAMDSATLDGTLTTLITTWLLLSWLISFFVGSLVTARLAGRIDDTSGMLHGVTVWAVGTVVTVGLGYYGLATFASTGRGVVNAVAKGVGNATSATATGLTNVARDASSITDDIAQRYGNEIHDDLVDQASEIAASGTKEVKPAEIRRAINSLDDRTVRRIVEDLFSEDSEGAAQLVANATKLSQEDARALVDSTYKELEEKFGNPDNKQSLSKDIKAQFASKVDTYLAALDQKGGPEVSKADIRQAIMKLEPEAMQKIAARLINGDVNAAKRTLIRTTGLSEPQVNELIDGASAKVENRVKAYEKEVDKAVDAASTYLSEILWVLFSGAAAALAACMVGGYIGADSSARYSQGRVGYRN